MRCFGITAVYFLYGQFYLGINNNFPMFEFTKRNLAERWQLGWAQFMKGYHCELIFFLSFFVNIDYYRVRSRSFLNKC